MLVVPSRGSCRRGCHALCVHVQQKMRGVGRLWHTLHLAALRRLQRTANTEKTACSQDARLQSTAAFVDASPHDTGLSVTCLASLPNGYEALVTDEFVRCSQPSLWLS